MSDQHKFKIEMWEIDRLIPYEKNAKIHTDVQVESLAKVIKSQGWDVPIVVDRDGSIIKGHGRRLAAISLGLKTVPVICRRDMTPEQVKAARLSDNRVALTDFDANLIKTELSDLSLGGFDMNSLGFDSKEIDMLVKDLDSLNSDAFNQPVQAPDPELLSAPTSDSAESAPAAPQRTVTLDSVLGFKSIPEATQRDLVKFLSYAESETGLRGPAAFTQFCKDVVDQREGK